VSNETLFYLNYRIWQKRMDQLQVMFVSWRARKMEWPMFNVLCQYITTKTLRRGREPKKEPREHEAWYWAPKRDVQFVLTKWIPLFTTQCANRWWFLNKIQNRKWTQGLGQYYTYIYIYIYIHVYICTGHRNLYVKSTDVWFLKLWYAHHYRWPDDLLVRGLNK
jgi:hypothetical protein